jgi:adenylate cyclase
VIGREFAEPVLAAVTELPAVGLAEALGTLTSAEFIQQQALYPAAEYAFKHPLTQEVAYGSQLAERRRPTHAAAARALEGFHRGSGGEKAAILAYHWESAGDGLAAARWHRRAAEWAGTSHAAQAWRHWQKVLGLLAPLPETAETVALQLVAYPQSLNLCWRLGSSEEEAMGLFVEGRRLAERAGDPRALAGLSYAWGIVKVQAGEAEEGLGHIAEAARQGEHIDERWRLALRVGLAYANLALGRLGDAFELIESVVRQPPADLRSGARIVGYSPFVALLACKGTVVAWMGSLDEAQRIFERTLELAALDNSDIEIRGNTHAYYSLCARLAGDVPLAAAHVRQALDIAERLGLTRSRVQAYRELGALRVLEGQWHEAVEALEAALAIGRQSGIRAYDAFVMADLPEAYLGVGDLGRARATANEAVTVSQRQRLALPECLAHIALARVLVHAGEGTSGEIDGALRTARGLVEKTGAGGLQPFIHVERAALARLGGDAAARQRELGEAQRLFAAMGAPIRAEQVARELGA